MLKSTALRVWDFFFSFLQALEDHTIRHAKILEALEAEKQKIAEEIQSLQKNRGSGNKTMTSMYICNVARAMLTSFLLGGLGLTGYGSRSFFSSSNTSLMNDPEL